MSTPRTAAATAAAMELVGMGLDRREMGKKSLLFIAVWCAVNGLTTEPESRILLGRAGMLKKFAGQGYFKQIDLPPGLKAAPYFPHLHYFQLTEKGLFFLVTYLPHMAQYGNLELRQGIYLHNFIARIEAAWRIRICDVQAYVPEIRLPDLASPFQKQHDGHLITFSGQRIGLEVEAADWKSGEKLARFVAQCLNSITSDRVQRIQILVQTEAAQRHYTKPFAAGEDYHPEWVKENGRWYPRKISKTVIPPELAAMVKVDLVLREKVIAAKLHSEPTIWLHSVKAAMGHSAEQDE